MRVAACSSVQSLMQAGTEGFELQLKAAGYCVQWGVVFANRAVHHGLVALCCTAERRQHNHTAIPGPCLFVGHCALLWDRRLFLYLLALPCMVGYVEVSQRGHSCKGSAYAGVPLLFGGCRGP